MKVGPLVVLTGAGISKESGLNTFRDTDGEWAKVRLEDVATPEGFRRDPDRVQAFYNARRRRLFEVQPNPAHHALALLEREWPADFLLVTQNIDDLHQRAGSRRVIPMHGELLKVRCEACSGVSVWHEDVSTGAICRCCGKAGRLRPHVVWFNEIPLQMDEIFDALSRCTLFVSIGTSGTVYPAAGFVDLANQSGAHTVEINLEPSHGQSLFAEKIYGPASVEVPKWATHLLESAKAPR